MVLTIWLIMGYTVYYVDVRNYSGTYDGQPHAANVTVYEWGYPCLDYVAYGRPLVLNAPNFILLQFN